MGLDLPSGGAPWALPGVHICAGTAYVRLAQRNHLRLPTAIFEGYSRGDSGVLEGYSLCDVVPRPHQPEELGRVGVCHRCRRHSLMQQVHRIHLYSRYTALSAVSAAQPLSAAKAVAKRCGATRRPAVAAKPSQAKRGAGLAVAQQ